MSTHHAEEPVLEEGLLVEMRSGRKGAGRHVTRFLLIGFAEGTLQLQPAWEERTRGLPRAGQDVSLVLHRDAQAWKVGGTVAAIEGSRVEPILTVSLHTAWLPLPGRTSKRYAVEIPAVVRAPDTFRSGQVAILRGRVLDLSTAGCRLRLTKDLPKGTVLALTFTLPGTSSQLVLLSQVVRSSEVPDQPSVSDLGIRFIQVGQEVQEALSDWLASRVDSKAA